MSDNDTDHLANLSDGAGCAEVWEHLSEQREAAAEESGEDSEEDSEETAEAEAAEETGAEEDAPEQDAAAEVPCP